LCIIQRISRARLETINLIVKLKKRGYALSISK